MSDKKVLYKIRGLKKHFAIGRGQVVRALDGIDIDVYEGETLGLVGESGCGKTTLGRTIIKIYQPTEGTVEYRGSNIYNMNKREVMDFTKKVQMIFQDPYASLDPRMTVGSIVGEGIDIHKLYKGKVREDRIR